MGVFWRTLMDFISVELHGFPFTLREDWSDADAKFKETFKTSESPAPSEQGTNRESEYDLIEDPLDSLPKNSLKHMVKLPKHFERLMCYSLSLCLDALLFEMTLMPLQAIATLLYLTQKVTSSALALYRNNFSLLWSHFGLRKRVHRVNNGCLYLVGSPSSDELAFMGGNGGEGGGKEEEKGGKKEEGKGKEDASRDNTNHSVKGQCQNSNPIQSESLIIVKAEEDQNVDTNDELVKLTQQTQNGVAPSECEESNTTPSGVETKETEYEPKSADSPSIGVNTSTSNLEEAVTKPDGGGDTDSLLNPNEACGYTRFVALLLAVFILSHIDTSRVYHNIRGQPFVKLYVIFNMLEVCEGLCRSFGRDCTDILIRSTIKVFQHCSNFRMRRQKMAAVLEFERFECPLRMISRQISKTNEVGSYSTNDANIQMKPRSDSISSVGGVKGISPIPALLDERDKSGIVLRFPKTTAVELTHDLTVLSKRNMLSNISLANLPDRLDILAKHTEGRELRHVTAEETERINSQDSFSSVYNDPPKLTTNSSVDTTADSVVPDSPRYPTSWQCLLPGLFVRYLLVVFYVLFHSFMQLVRVLSLNIAINSSESAMFLLLVTNNFAEIKSTVFKKFNETTLFGIVANDAVERFHLCFDAMLVFFKMSTVESPLKSYLTVSRWLIKMFMLEVVIDYFKHSFLLKFNKIQGDVFKRYTEVLMADVLLSRCQRHRKALINFNFRVMGKGAYSFAHIPARRLGFMPSPMLTLIICNVPYIRNGLTMTRFFNAVGIWLSFFFLKITTSILLVAHGIKKHKNLRRLKPPMDTVTAL